MSRENTNRRVARIVGGLLIVGFAALVVGLQAVHEFERTAAGDPDRNVVDSAKSTIAIPSWLKSAPPRRFPLTLANEPSGNRAGVITADYYESATMFREPREKAESHVIITPGRRD